MAGLDLLVVQDIFLTKTAEMADVVLPASASWCESDGTVTSSERRVQRVRKALNPPGAARDDIAILCDLAQRCGHDWGRPSAEAVWDEAAEPVPLARRHELRAARGAERPPVALPGRVPSRQPVAARPPVEGTGRRARARRSCRWSSSPQVDTLTPDFPIRLTTGRRLDSFNTGVQTGGYHSPLHRGESLDLCREDAARLGVADGEIVRVVSRRGSIEAPVRLDDSLRPGLAFMTMHFPDRGGDERPHDRFAGIRNRAPPSSRPRRFGWRSSACG